MGAMVQRPQEGLSEFRISLQPRLEAPGITGLLWRGKALLGAARVKSGECAGSEEMVRKAEPAGPREGSPSWKKGPDSAEGSQGHGVRSLSPR